MVNSSLTVWDVKKEASHYKRVFHGMVGLFKEADGGAKSVDGLSPEDFYALQNSAHDWSVNKAEFKAKMTWAKFTEVLGATYMERFKDLDGDGDVDMDDIWLQLDADGSGTLSIEEFAYSVLDRPAAWKEVFEIFSEEGNISVDDLGAAVRSLGFNPDDAEVMAIVNKYDVNADGNLDYSEFAEIVKGLNTVLPDDVELKAKIQENFSILAKGATTITTGELSYVMTALGSKLEKPAAEAMVKVVDANGDGSVDYTEFLAMRGVPNATFEVTW
jgi:Ca2+-binding EF-hand superfamily protein